MAAQISRTEISLHRHGLLWLIWSTGISSGPDGSLSALVIIHWATASLWLKNVFRLNPYSLIIFSKDLNVSTWTVFFLRSLSPMRSDCTNLPENGPVSPLFSLHWIMWEETTKGGPPEIWADRSLHGGPFSNEPGTWWVDRYPTCWPQRPSTSPWTALKTLQIRLYSVCVCIPSFTDAFSNST